MTHTNRSSVSRRAIKCYKVEAKRCKRKWDSINMSSVRPVRDEMNLARHFSAGNSENKQLSPIGTTEWSSFIFSRPYGPEKESISSPGRGDQTIARGERSEPLVGIIIGKSPEGAKVFCFNIFRPSRALAIYYFTRGSLRSPLAIVLRRSAAQFSIFSHDLRDFCHLCAFRPGTSVPG